MKKIKLYLMKRKYERLHNQAQLNQLINHIDNKTTVGINVVMMQIMVIIGLFLLVISVCKI